jgi:hypothetical protein
MGEKVWEVVRELLKSEAACEMGVIGGDIAEDAALSLSGDSVELDREDRMLGVSRDSRALGSSSFVNLPMEGR